jgi:sugar phosphate isomerase/epimerase
MNKKNDKKNKLLSRRQFIKNSLALGTGILGASTALGAPTAMFENAVHPNSKFKGVQIGVTTYSYRSMPNKSVEGQLKYILDDGINAVELVGNPVEKFAGRPELENRKRVAEWRANVSMDKFAKIRKMFNNGGVSIYTWKPRKLFDKNATDAELDYAFRVAKMLGAAACTTEHPRDDALTKRLGKFAAKHKILIAYHAHTDASPTLWDTALKQSKWNAINLDVGHWVAGGNPSPIPFIKKHHDRIESLHFKDRTTPAHGAKNLPWGQGDTPLVQILQLMQDQRYTFPASVELEYKIPKGSNAVKEVDKCVEYCRKALER